MPILDEPPLKPPPLPALPPVTTVKEKSPGEKYCLECGAIIRAKAVICPECGVPQDGGERRRTKYCQECGATIRGNAVVCPKCGVRQAGGSSGRSIDGVKIPLLIAAISNIVIGAFWALTCYGIIFTVPLIILCVLEFNLHSQADRLPPAVFGEKAKTLAIFQVILVFNVPGLVCGILMIINGGKLAGAGEENYG